MSPDRAAVIVVRIWVEGPEGPLRARITQNLDLGTGEQVAHGAATLEQILILVRDSVEAFLAREGDSLA